MIVDLEAPGGLRKLLGRKGPARLAMSPAEIVVEHPGLLRAPLRVAPGGVAAAAVQPGSARPDSKGDGAGRFAILRRLSKTAVVPREEGIEGWLWTSTGGSALTLIAEDDVAPNVALLFLKPLEEEYAAEVFEPSVLEDLAKRSPLGAPTVFGILLRVTDVARTETELSRLNLIRPLTDREVPPAQRRHLPTDRPADPSIGGDPDAARARTSIPPPGMG